MQTRTKVLVASAAVAALTLAGGTLALWSDSDTVDVDVTSGHLDLLVDELTAWDVSSFVRSAGGGEYHAGSEFEATPAAVAIDVETFKFVPEDVVRLLVPVDVDLLGDNLVANLDVTLADDLEANGFSVDSWLLTGDNVLSDPQPVARIPKDDNTPTVTFTAETADAELDAYAVVEISYDDTDTDGPENDNQNVTLADVLADTVISLSQVRD